MDAESNSLKIKENFINKYVRKIEQKYAKAQIRPLFSTTNKLTKNEFISWIL